MTDLREPLGSPELREHVERVLLGGERRYDPVTTSRLAGVELERAERLWRAMGFPDVPAHARVFTDEDVEALRITSRLVGEERVIDESFEVSISRMLGQTMGRLAQWQVRTVLAAIEARPEAFTDPAEIGGLIERIVPQLEFLQSHVWRRQLAAFAGRALAADDLESDTLAVGFADMTGFTALTRRLREGELEQLLERFEATAGDVVGAHDGRVVKSLGDEVLFTVAEPAAAAEIALTLLERTEDDDLIPPLRIGMAAGEVLSRLGDVYGPVVNIASRLTSLARPGRVLVDREMAAALAAHPAYRVRTRRPVSVRGYSHLHPYQLRRA